MTGTGYLVCAALICASAVGALLVGLRLGSLDQDSYWQGFADGEQHAQLNERTPSAN